MSLPPTVENLWITVGISLISVGKARKALNQPEAHVRVFGSEGGLSTKKRWLPTAYPHGGFGI
jgi:hypothetical protein